MKKLLVVIDGNSLINRGYYAIQKPMITKEGIYTQGIYAFLSMLSKIRNDYNPTHMLVAFDRKAPTFRHLEFKEYKAGRKGMPIELAMEMPILKDILDAMGIARFEIDGYEADDIIGTATKIAENEGFESVVITGDRDALQLAGDITKVVINKKGMTEFKLYDDEAMKEEYGFDHIQFIDYKALRGDTSDNIPGIPGVGEKTATALIQQFGSLENLLNNLDQVSNSKLREKIEDNAMSAMMSKRLATIIRTVPMNMSFDDFCIREQNTDALIDLYTKLEFKTFLSNLVSVNSGLKSEEIESNIPQPITVTDIEEAEKLFKSFNDIYIDIDTDNNHVEKPRISGIRVINNKDDKEQVYIFELNNLNEFVLNAFKDIRIKISGFNLGRLFYFLISNGIDCQNIMLAFDCSIAEYILNPVSKSQNINELLLSYFHVNIQTLPDQISLFDDKSYNAEAVKTLFLTKKLAKVQEENIRRNNLEKVYYDIELPLCKVLAAMEAEGIKLDSDMLINFGKMLKAHINELEAEIIELAGERFNINSPQQLGNILFEKLGIPGGKKTQRGYSTSADILEKLAPDYPIIGKILDYRTYSKLNSTYVEGLLPLVASDGRIHAHFNQTVTATGRISCTEPNLQNIPIRTELGRELRRCFTAAAEDHVLVGADYSQIELRVLAAMSGDETLIGAFKQGHDIHKETASRVFGVSLDDVTPQQRSNAKAVNFGVIYGMSQYGLSTELTISRKEAEKYINNYFDRFKDVKLFMDSCISECKQKGEIRTLFGRRRSVPEINASQFNIRQLGERLAMNTPIQGTAADIIKIAMIKVYERLKSEVPEARLILQIHDELIIDAPSSLSEKVMNILNESMITAVDLPVNLEVSSSISYNWYDLK